MYRHHLVHLLAICSKWVIERLERSAGIKPIGWVQRILRVVLISGIEGVVGIVPVRWIKRIPWIVAVSGAKRIIGRVSLCWVQRVVRCIPIGWIEDVVVALVLQIEALLGGEGVWGHTRVA